MSLVIEPNFLRRLVVSSDILILSACAIYTLIYLFDCSRNRINSFVNHYRTFVRIVNSIFILFLFFLHKKCTPSWWKKCTVFICLLVNRLVTTILIKSVTLSKLYHGDKEVGHFGSIYLFGVIALYQ